MRASRFRQLLLPAASRNSSYPHARVSSTLRPFDSIIHTSEFWIARRSLSSGGHSADPLAGDDGRDRMIASLRANGSAHSRNPFRHCERSEAIHLAA